MKRLTGVVMAGTLLALIVLNASRLQAQGTNTLEDLIEKFQLLTSDQGELAERLAAMETAVASANVLAGIPIQDENRCTPYHSADYPYPASLEAQIVAELKGKFYSPYTGKTFTRAVEVDIEHIVARSEAHDSGLCAADIFTRRAFASDTLNLTFAEPAVNRDQKVAKDVAEWLPQMNQCWYVNRVVAVKRRYGLSMDAKEAEAARSVLASCPSFAMVFEVEEEDTPTPAPDSTLTPAAEGTDTPTTDASQASDSPAEDDPLSLYDDNNNGRITCSEARSHGIAPVHRGHPAYQYMDDKDDDGVVCE